MGWGTGPHTYEEGMDFEYSADQQGQFFDRRRLPKFTVCG